MSVDTVAAPERLRALTSGASGWRVLEQALCAALLVLLGWRGIFHLQLSYGMLIGLALLPIWIGAPRRYRGARAVLGIGVLACVVGGLLSATAGLRDRTLRPTLLISDLGLLIVLLVGIGVMLWSRQLMSARWVGVFFGLGLMIRAATTSGASSDTPWKFAWAIPTTVVVLSLVNGGRPRRLLSVVVLLALAGISSTQDARSLFATYLLAALLMAWQLRPRSTPRPATLGLGVLLLAGLAVAVYNLGVGLLVDGYFGEDARQRTEQQIQSAGSVILGGRPELAATLALIRHNPLGLGLGVSPSVTDISLAKTAMQAIGYDPYNGYVDNYMFGGHIEVHSTFGDLWALTGLAGLAFTAVIVVALAGVLIRSMTRRDGNGLLVFMVCYSGWNLVFSPFFSAIPILTVGLGLGLALKSPSTPEPDPIPTPDLTPAQNPAPHPARRPARGPAADQQPASSTHTEPGQVAPRRSAGPVLDERDQQASDPFG